MFPSIAVCAFMVQGENANCTDIFFVSYQSCGYSSVLSWMKNYCAAAVVTGKVFPLHLVWNTRTKFFCNKLHEDIITKKMSLKVQIFNPAMMSSDGSFLWMNRVTILEFFLC